MIGPATFRVDGARALITGSSTGLGLALARGLAQSGATVVLNGRDEARLGDALATLRAEGLPAHAQAFDVCDADAVEAAVAAIERDIGPIDILVNNAGTTRRRPFHELTADDWNLVVRTNFDALYVVGHAVARGMVARRRGNIVNICSVMSDLGRPGTSAYTASKGGAKMLTKAMAIDLAPYGIRVNGIAPGYFKTELTAPLVADPKFSTWVEQRNPMGRWGEPDELAPAVVFLASDAARFITGHLLVVDGGLTATL